MIMMVPWTGFLMMRPYDDLVVEMAGANFHSAHVLGTLLKYVYALNYLVIITICSNSYHSPSQPRLWMEKLRHRERKHCALVYKFS